MIRNKLLLLILTTLLFAGGAFAAPACTSFTTLDQYLASVCTVGALTFDFTGGGAYSYTPDDTNPAASDIHVTVIGTGTVVGQQVGLLFSSTGYTTPSVLNPFGAGWSATNPDISGNNYADLNLTFNVYISGGIPPYLLNSTTTAVDVSIITPDDGATAIDVGEPVTDLNTNGTIGSINLEANADDSATSIANSGTALTVSSSFSTNTNALNVNKDILLYATDTPNGANLNSLSETFTFANTPEPGSFVLMGLAMILFAAYRWRKAIVGLVAVLALAAISVPVSNAAPMCVNVAQNMQAYINLGSGGCTIGADLFDNFSFTEGASSGVVIKPNSPYTFTVSAITGSGTAGIRFQPTVAALSPNAFTSFTISFDVKIGETLQTPGVTSTDTMTYGGTGSLNGTHGTSKLTVSGGATGSANYVGQGSSSVNCCGGVASGTTFLITNTFDLSAGTGNVHVSNVTDTLDETVGAAPEPVSMMLLGSGLLGVVLIGRKKVVKRS